MVSLSPSADSSTDVPGEGKPLTVLLYGDLSSSSGFSTNYEILLNRLHEDDSARRFLHFDPSHGIRLRDFSVVCGSH